MVVDHPLPPLAPIGTDQNTKVGCQGLFVYPSVKEIEN